MASSLQRGVFLSQVISEITSGSRRLAMYWDLKTYGGVSCPLRHKSYPVMACDIWAPNKSMKVQSCRFCYTMRIPSPWDPQIPNSINWLDRSERRQLSDPGYQFITNNVLYYLNLLHLTADDWFRGGSELITQGGVQRPCSAKQEQESFTYT